MVPEGEKTALINSTLEGLVESKGNHNPAEFLGRVSTLIQLGARPDALEKAKSLGEDKMIWVQAVSDLVGHYRAGEENAVRESLEVATVLGMDSREDMPELREEIEFLRKKYPPPSSLPSDQTIEITDPRVNLIDQVNGQLRTSNSTNIYFQGDPQVLAEYAKTLELPFGARIEEMKIGVGAETLGMKGVVNSNAGRISIEGDIIPTVDSETGDRGIYVSHLNITLLDWKAKMLPGLHTGLQGKIEQYFMNLDRNLRAVINRQIQQANPGWHVAGFRIEGQKLQLDFAKSA